MSKTSFRTAETSQRYLDLIATGALETHCALCDAAPLKAFMHWKLIANDFPYDQIAKLHHMLVPLRHATESELTEEELKEFAQIKASELQKDYEYMLEATSKQKSIPGHYHLHLLVLKD